MTRVYSTITEAYNTEVWPIINRLARMNGIYPIDLSGGFLDAVIKGEAAVYRVVAPTVLAHEIAKHALLEAEVTNEQIWSAMGQAKAEREQADDAEVAGKDADVERALELLQTLTSTAIELASIVIRLKR